MCALPVWPNVAPHSRTDYGWSPEPPMIRALLIGLAWFATLEGPGSHQAPDPLAARTKGRRTAAGAGDVSFAAQGSSGQRQHRETLPSVEPGDLAAWQLGVGVILSAQA